MMHYSQDLDVKLLIFILFIPADNEELPEDYNPFTMPADNDIFMLRDKERQRKKAVSRFTLLDSVNFHGCTRYHRILCFTSEINLAIDGDRSIFRRVIVPNSF